MTWSSSKSSGGSLPASRRLRHRLDSIEFATLPDRAGEASSAPVSPEVLMAVSAAVRARQVLRFDYASHRPSDDTAAAGPRRVEPHHLVTSRGRWYLVGWDLERGDWRIFRADRITPRTLNGPRFSPRQVPGGDVTAYVSARFTGSELTNGWPCNAKVVLSLPARDVLPLAGDGMVEDLGDDRCSLHIGSWSWTALAAGLNRFDTDVEVITPPELTEAFAQLATRNAASAASRAVAREEGHHAPQ